MIIHAYFVCFNEEKIIDRILDYYSKFCSRIYIFDNGSTDNSISIAKSYPMVRVLPFDTGGKKNNAMHVSIKSQAYKDYSREGGKYSEEAADWIICCDMDEVLYHPNLVEVLSKYKELNVTVPQITGFDMVSDVDVDNSQPLISQYSNGVRNPVFDKRVVFQASFDISYSLGCHPFGPGFDLMKETIGYSTSNDYPLALLHYKNIGGLLYESAVKNLERFDKDNIHKRQDGGYAGPGSHYAFFVEKGEGYSPLLKQARPVLDHNRLVLFNNFMPTTGEKGHEIVPVAKISQDDVDLLREAALLLESVDLVKAHSLMKLALRFRPTGPFIKRKVEEYKVQLGIA